MSHADTATTPKVLQIIHNLKQEGAQRVMINLALELPALGWGALIHPWRKGGPFLETLREAGVPVDGPPTARRSVPAALSHMVALCRAHDIRLIHAHQVDGAVLGAMLSWRCGLPLVITHHSTRILPHLATWSQRLVRTPLYTLAARRAAVNVAVSADVATLAARQLGLPEERMTVVPNGVPVGAEPGDWRPRPAPRLLMIGRLNRIKAHIQMIEALPALRERFPGLTVRLVGDGRERETLAARAVALGVAEAVDMAGLVDDVTAELAAADLLVSTSHYEGAPMGILEAMGQGVPVVASDVPGTRAVVRAGETGRLYPLNAVPALADAVTAALREPEETARLARAAWRETAERASRAAMARAYVALYQDCLRSAAVAVAEVPSSSPSA